MRIARIFVCEPAGTMFDVVIGDQPLGSLVRSWAVDGFVLPDPVTGPFIPWSNVILIVTYDQAKPGAVVTLVPKDPA